MKIISTFLILGVVSTSWAALPPKKSNEPLPLSAQEILAMPEENRNQVAMARSGDLYPELIHIANSEKAAIPDRWKALTLAAYIGRDKAVKDLEAALKSKEWFMRNAALLGLKIHHPLRAQSAARNLLKDKALVVRSAAVEVLGPDLDRKSRDLLWEELNADYNFRKKQGLWIRSQILGHLSEKPDAKESQLFVKALMEKDSSMHAPAITALEKLTQKKLTARNGTQKRELWIQWAKSQPQMLSR